MTYGLGIDVGSSTTGAAVAGPVVASTVALGRRTRVDTRVTPGPDGRLRAGDAAGDGGATDFRRRVGDPAPIEIRGAAYAPAALVAAVVRDVVATVTTVRDAAPATVVLTCPAMWGPYRRHAFDEVKELAGVAAAGVVTDAEAVAVRYGGTGPRPGRVVVVLDLGATSADASVLVAGSGRWRPAGTVESAEAAGGDRLDRLVLALAAEALGGDPAEWADRPGVLAACRLGRERLSEHDRVLLRLPLPGHELDVEVSRDGYERRLAGALAPALEAVHRALNSAELEAAAVDEVLLAGGVSRTPFVPAHVRAEFGRPVRCADAPEDAAALGAAMIAAETLGPPEAAPAPAEEPPARVPRRLPAVRLPAWRPDRRSLLGVAGVAVVAVTAAVAVGTLGGEEDRAATPAAASRLIGTVAGLGPAAEGLAVSADGDTAWVTGRSPHRLQEVDVAGLRVLRTVPLPGPPRGVALAPDGAHAYVTTVSPGRPTLLVAVDTATARVTSSVEAGRTTSGPVTTPDGDVVLPDEPADRLLLRSAVTLRDLGALGVPGSPRAVAASPDGGTVLAAGPGELWVVDLAGRAPTLRVPVGADPEAVAASPGGGRVAAADCAGRAVVLLDPRAGRLLARVPVAACPAALAWTPDGRYVLAAGGDAVSVLDAATHRVVAQLPVGRGPVAVAVDAAGERAFVVNATGGSLTVLDLVR